MRVHIQPMTRANPARAQSIDIILDFVNQLVGTIRGLLSLFGFGDFGDFKGS